MYMCHQFLLSWHGSTLMLTSCIALIFTSVSPDDSSLRCIKKASYILERGDVNAYFSPMDWISYLLLLHVVHTILPTHRYKGQGCTSNSILGKKTTHHIQPIWTLYIVHIFHVSGRPNLISHMMPSHNLGYMCLVFVDDALFGFLHIVLQPATHTTHIMYIQTH
ncbi:hypothetical protein ACJX0J_008663, partial [Zea mays]